ncbi:hypothetical protein [Myroides odoratus]|uniref:Lipoprotein n=1 Tax=Myroides odoratus TaxID=256 RepID=A0A9Q6Z3S6_MYROD|nr:hypothetical protein [Myroides odoratus]EHQ41346.1 hypothetical protein Myrod_0510 [Myroides odoratus DSM 2801]EKB08646.1 hypothetical protein HMPREF9716_00836 [Myroides odoratus CIP 103059]QQT98780.1 hypothetical protein I6I88_11195 [Myroides odoratus]WQD59035.1 hypothetical protein U0010_07780 [Myroides odoratus]STZ32386.1 Uncharacterised protein [Myroides odoratus]
MKKIIAILVGSIALASCSSDDNKSSSDDPIFSQPYEELKSLDELAVGKYAYIGNKIGDRKVGVVGETSNCKRVDYLVVHRNPTTSVLDSLTYNNFRLDKIEGRLECMSIFEFPRLLQKNELVRSGYMRTSIEDGYLKQLYKDDGKTKDGKKYERKDYFKGEIEIGFQAGYLRIEDRLSDYKRLKDEKVYLYFKKL